MTPFLKLIANHYFETEKESIKDLCFIFPNRRAMAFFGKYLSEAVHANSLNSDNTTSLQPILAPFTTTINDFVFKLCGQTPSDKVDQVLELYNVYKEVYKSANPGKEAESLDNFIFWGDIMLADFNDIDKYLIDASKLLINVSEFKEIQADLSEMYTEEQLMAINTLTNHFVDVFSGSKNVSTAEASGASNNIMKERFLHMWNLLYPIYEEYNAHLAELGLNYEGMVYRSAAEQFSEKLPKDILSKSYPRTKKFVFVGMNALNECEKAIMKALNDASMADFCWDYFSEVIKDKHNKSSLFLHSYCQQFPQADFLANLKADYEIDGAIHIKTTSIPSAIGQAKLVPQILQKIANENAQGDLSKVGSLEQEGTDCAIVIPDEDMLIPLLNSLPDEITDINVTMGYPMKSSNFYSLMDAIIGREGLQMRVKYEGSELLFYHKPLWTIFSNGIFKKICSKSPKVVAKVQKVKKAARLYVPASELTSFIGEESQQVVKFFKVLFSDSMKNAKDGRNEVSAENIINICTYQKALIEALAPLLRDDYNMALELEFALKYYQSVNRLMTKKLNVKPLTYSNMLDSLLINTTVPFRGEPLKGLQIMGPLETRVLDFTNIIILSCNEDKFPKRSVSSSFIPPELRKGFGMPTYEFQDAVWAYYFYRMLQRARSMWLISDSRPDENEESRYIKQLQYQFSNEACFSNDGSGCDATLQNKYGNINFERISVKAGSSLSEGPDGDDEYVLQTREAVKTENGVAEDDSIIQAIKKIHFSYSSFADYIACPAKFYYYKVLKLVKQDEVQEELETNTFGTVFHAVMERLYSTGVGLKNNEKYKPERLLDAQDKKPKWLQNCPENAHVITKEYMDILIRESEMKKEFDVDNLIMLMIKEEIAELSALEGVNIVYAHLIYRYVNRTLLVDKKLMSKKNVSYFLILGTEIRMSADVAGLKFMGFIDRLDSFAENEIRVVDYKTGSYDERNMPGNYEERLLREVKDVRTIEIEFANKNTSKIKIPLQLYIYDKFMEQFIEQNSTKEKGDVVLLNSIYNVVQIAKGEISEAVANKELNSLIDKEVEKIVKELLSPDNRFKRCEDSGSYSLCNYCDFTNICGR